jgi:Cof subfamily protein (haloacid dehalogenase superfamily)
MIGLVCIDVDGTLVGSSGTVSNATWAAAARVRARGVRLAVCSGRPAFGVARGYAERLDAEGWHIFQNGASVLHLPHGLTRSRPLASASVTALVEQARTKERLLELYTDREYAVERDVERARRHAALLGVPWRRRDLLSLGEPVIRAQWLVSHEEVEAVLAEPHEGITVSHSVSPVMPDTSFLNLTPAGVDKARAVRTVAKEYGIPLEHVMMVGDSANDVTAMQLVGVPIAMGNAEPEVREVAGYEVAHVDEDGLVEALEMALTITT